MITDFSENIKTVILRTELRLSVPFLFMVAALGGDGEGGEKVGYGASATPGTGGGTGVEKRTVCRLARCIASRRKLWTVNIGIGKRNTTANKPGMLAGDMLLS